MNSRECFQKTMHFQSAERIPNIEVGCWGETYQRWLTEGMPDDTGLKKSSITFNGNEYFGLDGQVCLGLKLGMIPGFESEIIEEDEETIVSRNSAGAITKGMKDGSSMPQYLSFAVQNREDFQAMRKQYEGALEERYPDNWNEIVSESHSSEVPVWAPGIGSVGLYSMIRTWMGTENACTIFYDDPVLAHEMVDFITDFTLQVMEKALKETKIDYFMWWEDFSFKNGPLVSPPIFKEFLLDGYRKVNEVLRSAGIDLIMIDTDGDPRVLIPLLLESGINCLYPLEQCNEKMHPEVLRREYGHDLLLWGGIDKRELTKSKKEIDQELQSKIPALIEDGGFIPQLDHLAPPDIPYENWCYYLKEKLCLLS